jgi:ADP-L-glycero-D-manno-heptose 6-epimerase
MIVVTGAAGFIGSAMVWKLNQMGIDDILVVDDLGMADKWKNLVGKKFSDYFHKTDFIKALLTNKFGKIEAIIHLGACSATTEKDAEYLMQNNFAYTKDLATYAVENKIRFLYASSAATYGDGALGYSDADLVTPTLVPLNMYGYSKQLFDMWAMQNEILGQITGFKFFNVFGPNEYHKEDMSSVVFKAFGQIQKEGKLRLFKSDRDGIGDGEQRRDFVYVKDCIDVMAFFLQNRKGGVFNLGTGVARTFKDLATATFNAMKKPVNIEYIPMPDALKGKYQYFTQADMSKLRSVGYTKSFGSLEDSVADYVQQYLMKPNPHL